MIRSRTARTWLRKLGFVYKEVRKDVFIDGHERPDVVEDRNRFLAKMEELKPYMVEFNEDGAMKAKDYPVDCAVGGEERRPVIVITHDECTFSANNGIRKAWTRKGDTFLRPKGRGQGIMTSDFLLPFGRLNLASLSSEKRKEVVEKCGLLETEAVEVFEYGKNNDGYWDGAKLHKQVVSKALPIIEALYPGYSLLFLFDNTTSYSVYAKDVLQVQEMNKSVGGKQAQLRNGWFEKEGVQVEQLMNYNEVNGQCIPKGIQKVLEERNLWPFGGLNLEFLRPKYCNCQVVAECKICIKKHKYELCKIPRQDSGTATYTKNRRCDTYAHREENCECVGKKYCTTCAIKKGKYANCKKLSPKCTTNGNFFLIINYYMLINLLNYCVHHLLWVQPDFVSQKCEIEEFIIKSTNRKHHLVIYYPKYYYEFNYIEHFWCIAKK